MVYLLFWITDLSHVFCGWMLLCTLSKKSVDFAMNLDKCLSRFRALFLLRI